LTPFDISPTLTSDKFNVGGIGFDMLVDIIKHRIDTNGKFCEELCGTGTSDLQCVLTYDLSRTTFKKRKRVDPSRTESPGLSRSNAYLFGVVHNRAMKPWGLNIYGKALMRARVYARTKGTPVVVASSAAETSVAVDSAVLHCDGEAGPEMGEGAAHMAPAPADGDLYLEDVEDFADFAKAQSQP